MLNYMLTWLYVRLPRLEKEEGQGMAEYGLLLALIAVVVIAVVTTIGQQLLIKFGEVATALQ